MSGAVRSRAQPKSLTTLAERKRKLWLPSGAIDETVPRSLCATSTGITSGTLRLLGGVVILAGQAVASIAVWAVAAAVTPSHQWFCLVDQAGNVLAKTVNDGAAAWSAGLYKALAISGGPYTPLLETPVYVGVLVVATTPPTLASVQGQASVGGAAPITACNSTTGLTDPASLGPTVTFGVLAAPAHAYLS